jgi:nickel/cobalt transporter (NicO) family protein
MSGLPDIAAIIASNTANPWLYLPVAVLLGALHALEPGHAKSIMAAFIIAVRGTPGQAVLLGLSAAIGHTLVVWALVLAALWFGNDLIEQQAYPWLVLVAGVMIVAIAARLFWSIRKAGNGHGTHAHDHAHAHGHHHDHGHHHGVHDGHTHLSESEIVDRYAGRKVTTWEIVWFGFTGGLMPCPAAIAVLLAALKFKAALLGAAMVAAFSAGLAATLIAVGLAAAWGMQKAAAWSGMDRWARILPVVSAAIVLVMGLAVTVHGLSLLAV